MGILIVLDTFEINKTFLWSLPKLFCLWKGVWVTRPAGQLDCNGLIISLKKLHQIEAFFREIYDNRLLTAPVF